MYHHIIISNKENVFTFKNLTELETNKITSIFQDAGLSFCISYSKLKR